MKSNLIASALFMSISFFSCNEKGVIFEEHQELSANIQWDKSDKKTFVIPVNDNSKPYQFTLSFRYATGFQFQNMKMRITEKDPDGSTMIRDLDFRVRDEEGKFMGDAGYDIIDLDYVLEQEKKFPILGNYTYTIEHTMPTDPVHYAMEVGLVVRGINP
ncbi:MAG: gliding motility lipoprotein GldH [Flavobacteriales bacterium]|nr:gliding motility lipoprotein GldH [Flavobacteriales bacterium]